MSTFYIMFKPNLLCKDYAPGIPYCFHKVNEGQKNYKPGTIGNYFQFYSKTAVTKSHLRNSNIIEGSV